MRCQAAAVAGSRVCQLSTNPMPYDPKWRLEDERRNEWIEKLYRLDGRQHSVHPRNGVFTGLVQRFGPIPWK